METPSKLICHGQRLTPSSGFALWCYWCKTGGYISNGYHCTRCDRWFHKDCVNFEFPHKFYHTSHPQHMLTSTIRFKFAAFWCEVCRLLIEDDQAYHCFTCKKFNLHFSCAREAPPLNIKHPQAHKHPLVFFPILRNQTNLCEVCKENIAGELAYRCFECKVVLHVECVNSPEVNHPCHPIHSLKFFTFGTLDYIDNSCILCGLKLEGVLYHCSICNFSVCLVCASISPPVNVEHLKTHKHTLTLMARKISFTCNACGMQGDRSPYFCLQCDFMVHRSCIGLPHVVNINRHDHRIYHTQNQQFSFGDSVCKICLHNINRFYGAYSCLVCINYVVHSQCATRNDVWDGIELEGIHEDPEDIMSFKEVGDNLIIHFSHQQHNLKLNKDGTAHGGIGSIRCEACMLPVYSDLVYSCEQCSFILHKICANLPRKKHHMSDNKPFTLHVPDVDSPEVNLCSVCGEIFNGFRYESDNILIDVRCILTSESFSSENHEHPLHYKKSYIGTCDACHEIVDRSAVFSCGSCDYNLEFGCATLPKIVKHMCDQHPLSLSCKENANGKYWCDICEDELDPNKWFYKCNECKVCLHVKCVLGDFSRLIPGRVFIFRRLRLLMIPNNHSSRPICSKCRLRCKTSFILKELNMDIFICSERCLYFYIKSLKQLILWIKRRRLKRVRKYKIANLVERI